MPRLVRRKAGSSVLSGVLSNAFVADGPIYRDLMRPACYCSIEMQDLKVNSGGSHYSLVLTFDPADPATQRDREIAEQLRDALDRFLGLCDDVSGG